MNAAGFYDGLAPRYHLLFNRDFAATTAEHARRLAIIIEQNWPGEIRAVLDVSCGIGTQAIGLAGLGYQVTGVDISPRAVDRARSTADARRRRLGASCGAWAAIIEPGR